MKFKLPFTLPFSKSKKRKRSTPKNVAVYYRESTTRARTKGRKRPIKPKGKIQKQLPFSLHVIREKKRNILTFVSIVLVGVLFFLVFLSDFFHIQDVIVKRRDLYVNSVAIAKALEGIKGKHLLLLDAGQMEQVIYEKFPEIKEVRVEKLFPRTLRVDLTSFDVLARIQNEGQQEYFVNEAGVAVKQDNEQNDLPLIIIPAYGDVPEEERDLMTELVQIDEYKQIMSQEQLYYILETRRLFEEYFHIPVQMIQYLPIEDEVRLQTERGFFVWMSVREDTTVSRTFSEEKEYIESQIDKLRQALSSLNIYTAELSYIDLRISNKVIYCEQGASCTSVLNKLHQ